MVHESILLKQICTTNLWYPSYWSICAPKYQIVFINNNLSIINGTCDGESGLNVALECVGVICCVTQQDEHIDTLNLVILQAKWYIFCKKEEHTNIVFNEVLNSLMYRLK